MCNYRGSFLVEDASGARFDMHEFRCGRFWSRRTRFELDTGEIAQLVDGDTFEVAATGETLLRVDND